MDGHINSTVFFGLALSVYRSITVALANDKQSVRGMCMGRNTYLGNEDWRNVPFQGREKTSLDKLCDVLLSIQWANVAPGIILEDRLEPLESEKRILLAQKGIEALEQWWQDFCLVNELNSTLARFSTYRQAYHEMYRISALMVALHSGAIVKLCAVLNLLSPEHRKRIGQKLWQHSERVLTAVACVTEQSNYHAKLFASAPTSIVSMYGATAQQKEHAVLLLIGFDHVKSMGDRIVCEKSARLMLSQGQR